MEIALEEMTYPYRTQRYNYPDSPLVNYTTKNVDYPSNF